MISMHACMQHACMQMSTWQVGTWFTMLEMVVYVKQGSCGWQTISFMIRTFQNSHISSQMICLALFCLMNMEEGKKLKAKL